MVTYDSKVDNNEFESLLKALKDSEEKLENDKIKTEFFSNLSHEFKTPLNIIMGSIQLIELYSINGSILDPQKKLDQNIKTMKQNAYRLLKLINNIIDLTKIDSNYYQMDIHNYDIAVIIEDLINSVSLYAKLKSINISLIKDDDHKILACDLDKIERILLNLLSNALKFTDEDGNIEVRLWSSDSFDYISVKDDGIGIQKDKLNIIFERFRQADRSFTRNRDGSGIGLSLVKVMVEMHGGSIEVESEYGVGTTFIIKLPHIALNEEIQENLFFQYADSRSQRISIELSDI